jgi:hypothetical protein
MKLRTKIILCLVLGLILIGSEFFQFGFFDTRYGDLEIPENLAISEIQMVENGRALRTINLSESGSRLELQIKGEKIHVPWTMYLPFYQSGRITGVLVYDAHILEEHWDSLSVSLIQETTGFYVIPNIFIRKKIKTQLETLLLKAAEIRVSDSKKPRDKNGLRPL